MDIELECPCPEPQETTQTQSCNTCQQTTQLVQQLQSSIALLHQEQRFRNGQIRSGEFTAYGNWLNQMRETVIQRNRYYPNYQQDWGGAGVSSSGSGSPNNGTTSTAYVLIQTVTSPIQVGGISNLGPNPIDYQFIVTDWRGASQTIQNLAVGIGDFSFSSMDLANQLFPFGIVMPLVSVEYYVRSNVPGLDSQYESSFKWV